MRAFLDRCFPTSFSLDRLYCLGLVLDMIQYKSIASNDKCACKGAFIDRFVQPSILVLLSKEKMHGFSILRKLQESKDIDYSSIDPTGLYRALKKMESSGIISGEWCTDESAQPRKVYTITDEGRQCLAFWKETLTGYALSIERLAQAVSDSLDATNKRFKKM